MVKVVDIDTLYHCNADRAITLFFKKYPEHKDDWEESFRWMAKNGEDFFGDQLMADGTINRDWRYALHLDQNGDYTYIALIERA